MSKPIPVNGLPVIVQLIDPNVTIVGDAAEATEFWPRNTDMDILALKEQGTPWPSS